MVKKREMSIKKHGATGGLSCLKCHSRDHLLANYPSVKASNVCFKCGQTGHTFARFQKPGKDLTFARCFICDRTGHVAIRCLEKPNQCYICHEKGHWARDCPTKAEKKNAKKQATLSVIHPKESADAEEPEAEEEEEDEEDSDMDKEEPESGLEKVESDEKEEDSYVDDEELESGLEEVSDEEEEDVKPVLPIKGKAGNNSKITLGEEDDVKPVLPIKAIKQESEAMEPKAIKQESEAMEPKAIKQRKPKNKV